MKSFVVVDNITSSVQISYHNRSSCLQVLILTLSFDMF